MRTLGPLSTSPWPSSRAPPAAAVSVTGKVTAVTGKLADNRVNIMCEGHSPQSQSKVYLISTVLGLDRRSGSDRRSIIPIP